jgi:hypothetical protein
VFTGLEGVDDFWHKSHWGLIGYGLARRRDEPIGWWIPEQAMGLCFDRALREGGVDARNSPGMPDVFDE